MKPLHDDAVNEARVQLAEFISITYLTSAGDCIVDGKATMGTTKTLVIYGSRQVTDGAGTPHVVPLFGGGFEGTVPLGGAEPATIPNPMCSPKLALYFRTEWMKKVRPCRCARTRARTHTQTPQETLRIILVT